MKYKKAVKELEFVNKNEIRVVGMSRSGNHSIINWIIKQLSGRFCFLNCAEPKTNPFNTARPLAGNRSYKTNYQDFNLNAEQRGDFSQKDYLIHSYEDCFLGMINNRDFEQYHDQFVGPSGRRLDILILRDPFNLFASRKKSNLYNGQIALGGKTVTPFTATRIWKQHAKEFTGAKRYLHNHRLLINYNLWVHDKAYREIIAAALGIDFTDNGFHEVSSVAGGSSFDGLAFNSSAYGMQVLHRWKHYAHDQGYKSIFDDEIVSLSHKIFGYVPDERLLSAL